MVCASEQAKTNNRMQLGNLRQPFHYYFSCITFAGLVRLSIPSVVNRM